MTQSETINQDTINRAAWKACDIFRGAMDAANYKDYILTMLFLKYLSDVWKDHKEYYKQRFPKDPERIESKLEKLDFQLPTGSSFYDLYDQRNAPDIGDLINQATDNIENANRDKLEDVFRDIDFSSKDLGKETKDRNRRLKDLLERFNRDELDLRPSRNADMEDIIGNTYMYLIERFASDAGKKAGEFYTPHKVSQLVAKLCAPKPGARICDPACGSGGLLIEAAREVGSDNHSLYGMEVNGGTWALCKMNMFLHQFNSARIEWCDTLTNPELLDEDRQLMKFDYVVANPPFSLDNWGAEQVADELYNRFWRGMPPKNIGDYAFISHMIAVATPKKGRVAVVVPHGVLFRGGAEGRIRQQLIEENLLDAVIGLPPNLFLAAGIPVTVLVFDRSRERKGARRDVLFIDASHDFEKILKRNNLRDADIERIASTYEDRKDVDRYARLVKHDEIASKKFDLTISLYVSTSEEEKVIDIDAVLGEIRNLEQELTDAHERMDELIKKVRR